MHVAEVRVEEYVRHHGQHPVADRVPERLIHSVIAKQARSVDYFELPRKEGFDQPRDVLGQVFEVSVERQYMRSSGQGRGRAKRSTLSPVLCVPMQDYARILNPCYKI